MTSSDEPMNALDKYNNLQGDIEKIRQEVALRRATLAKMHEELKAIIQDRRTAMVDAIAKSKQEEQSWNDKRTQIHEDLQKLRQEQAAAETRRGCAIQVRSMHEQRMAEARSAMEASKRNFRQACQALLQESPGVFPDSSDHEDMEEDMEREETDTLATISPHILETDWTKVLRSIWSAEAAAVGIEERDDPTPSTERPQDKSSRTPLKEGTTAQDVSAEGREDSSDELGSDAVTQEGKDDEDETPATEDEIPDDCKELFEIFIKRIQAATATKDDHIAKAEAKVAKIEASHNKVVEAHDLVQKEHEVWSGKIHRQRDNQTNISNQVNRLQKDISDLQQQLSQAQAETRRMQEKMAPGRDLSRAASSHPAQSGRSIVAASGDISRKRSLSTSRVSNGASRTVRNPYAKSKSQRPPERANETLSHRHPRFPERVRHANMLERENHSPHVVVSPGGDSSSALVALPHHNERVDHQHPHRVGRIRRPRGFGVSLSLADVAVAPQGGGGAVYHSDAVQAGGSQRAAPETDSSSATAVREITAVPRAISEARLESLLNDEEASLESSDLEDFAKRRSSSSTPRRQTQSTTGRSTATETHHNDLPVVSTAKKVKARTSAVFADRDDQSSSDSSDGGESLHFAFRK